MMPPGAGGGSGERERERTTWLLEDRDVWCTDGDVAPRVVTGTEPDAGQTGYVVDGGTRPTRPYPPSGSRTATPRYEQSTG
jgi:hypothetical protein